MLARSALVRLANRKVLQVQGADAHRFLQAIITNDMKTVTKPHDAIYGAFLTTKGRVLGDCNVVQVEPETFLLDYDAAVSDELNKHWKRYKLRMKVTLADVSDRLSTYAALPATIAASGSTYIDVSNEVTQLLSLNEREASAAHGAVFCDPRSHAFGVRAILPPTDALKTPSEYIEAELQAYTDRRIFLGAAEGSELNDSIPLEADLELLRGVSFKKGCYVGQELTARTQFKGNVRKRFVPLALVPSSHTELAKSLSEQPFQRIDSELLESLREFLLESDVPRATIPEGGLSIHKPGSTKSVGSVLSVGKDTGVAIAMLRLEHVFPKEDGETPTMQFTTADGAFHAVPYQPTWWPEVDPKTGKMAM